MVLIVDKNLDVIASRFFSSMPKLLTVNSTHVLLEYSGAIYYYDLELCLLENKQFAKINESIGKTTLDLGMSDKYLFVLCNNQKLKIFCKTSQLDR
jgi:hypothetical protein